MAAQRQQVNESAVIRSLKRFRDRYFPNSDKVENDVLMPGRDAAEPQPADFDILPVRQILFRILRDVCRLFG